MASKVKVKGFSEVQARMKRRSKRMKNLRGPNLAAILAIRRWVDKNFQAQGRKHDDTKLRWEPLKPSTLSSRRTGKKETSSSKILQDTGRLKNSFNYSANKRRGTLRSAVSYAVLHEEGRGSIPQRKIFPTIKQGEKIAKPVYKKSIQQRIIDPK